MPRKTLPRIRKATLRDLPAILELEVACFQDYRRASKRSLRRSLHSPHQSMWVVDGPHGLSALLVLWHYPRTLRIYDIATHPDARGQGLGRALMLHAEQIARRAGRRGVMLEAEEADMRLVAWYESQGYRQADHLVDYYHGGCHAVRMVKRLAPVG